MLFCAFVGTAWAQELPFKTSNAPTDGKWAEGTTWYYIQFPNKDGYHTGGFLASSGEGFVSNSRFSGSGDVEGSGKLLITQTEKPVKNSALWCIVGDAENGFKFYNKANPYFMLGMTNDDAKVYNYEKDGITYLFDYAMSKHASYPNDFTFRFHGSENNCLNNQDGGGNPDYLKTWNHKNSLGDAGSVVRLIEATDDELAAIANKQPIASTGESTTYYKIKSFRSNDYATYLGDDKDLNDQAWANQLSQIWYFVTDGVTGGYKLHNAATENVFKSTNKFDETGSTVYVKENPYLADYVCVTTNNALTDNCWDEQSDKIGTWNPRKGDFEGTAWMLEQVDFASMFNELKNVSLNYILDAEDADFLTYADDAIATAKSVVENATATPAGFREIEAAMVALKASARTEELPKAGDYIQLKNKNYHTYLKQNGENANLGNASEFTAVWVLEAGENNDLVKIKNVATGKYLGQTRQSAAVPMVDLAEAKDFAFTRQSDMYAVFKDVSGGDYAYGHVNGTLLGWEKSAGASQWVISVFSVDDCLAVLQSAYDAEKNNFGVAVGMYKESDDLNAARTAMEEILSNVEGEKNVETLLAVLNNFKAQCASATRVEMVPGYYYVKGTGDEHDDPAFTSYNEPWYLTHYKNGGNDCMKAVVLGEGQKPNANHIWKFETSEDGYKLQQVNLGTYAKLIAAGGTSTVNSAVADGDKFTLTPETGAPSKFIIKNAGNHVMRTEGDGRVNYWGTESKETWYLIPATELEVEVTAAGYATLNLPFDVTLPNTVKAYAVEGVEGDWLTMEVKADIPANKGAILEGEGTHTLTIAPAISDWSKNLLLGTNVNTEITDEAYVLGNGSDGVGLYKALMTEGKWLNNANKAYLPASAVTTLAATLRFNFGGTTAIESVVNGVDANAAIYDLSGRRVEKAVKGIYIQNGKKIIVK